MSVQVPNPYVQMAWVTPSSNARDLAVKLYAEAAGSAVLMWDILLHLSEDYKLLRNYRISFLTVVYFFARFSTLAYLLGLTIVSTAPIGNCNLIRYIDFLYPLAVPFSILHFIPRVYALHRGNKYVFAFFTFTWLVVLATSILWPIGVQGQKLGPTNYCVEIKLHVTASIGALCLLIHDTLIFLATSWAIVSRSYVVSDNVQGKLKIMVLGKDLPRFTRLLLRDGQAYYLATLVINVMFLSQYYVKSPFVFPCSFGNPSTVLTTCMSAFVYRNTRLGHFKDYTTVNPATTGGVQRLSIVFNKTARDLERSNSTSSHGDKEKNLNRGTDIVEIDSGRFEESEKRI